MQADFLDAHQRHWNDAEMLFGNGRLANADHLYGMSAECGLKALMVRLNKGVLSKGDYLHIRESRKKDDAWSRYQTYLSGHISATKLSLPSVNPFNNWLADQRYANQSNFDQARVQAHQEATKDIRELIKKAKIEGIL